MKSKLSKLILICLALVVFANTAQAMTCILTVPPPFSTGGKFLVCPAGDGDLPSHPPFTLQLLDSSLVPIANYPFEDIRLEFVDPVPGPSPRVSFGFCNPGLIADSNTDADGMTTFSGGALFGCGSVRNPLIQVVVNSTACASTPTLIEIVSVDFNCDGMVTKAGDNPIMTALKSTCPWAIDLNHSPAGGLMKDASILAKHIFPPPLTHTCP